MKCVFYTCFVSFWYRALETSNRFVFYLSPLPKFNPPTGLLPQARTWVSAPLCGARRPVERVLSLRPFDGWREGRGGKRSWVAARPTNHLVLGFEHTPHHTRAIQGYYSGSIPGLLTSSAILGRQHRIPSDLRS